MGALIPMEIHILIQILVLPSVTVQTSHQQTHSDGLILMVIHMPIKSMMIAHSIGGTRLLTESDVQTQCYKTSSSFDMCFTKRASSSNADAIFSVKDHEDNMWAIHAGVMGSDPTKTDKMTDSHGGFSVSTSKLETYFEANSFSKLLENRLAYACAQSYVIDPTGFSIQAGGPGGSSFPGCGWSVSV
jgi:hypothetical protein